MFGKFEEIVDFQIQSIDEVYEFMEERLNEKLLNLLEAFGEIISTMIFGAIIMLSSYIGEKVLRRFKILN